MGRQRDFSSVLPRSKRIQKVVRSGESLKPKQNNGKKYKTFNLGDKKRILSSFKKNLTDLNLANPDTFSFSASELLKLLDYLHINDFNAVLSSTLPKHVSAFKTDVQSLRRWRRRIKEWIISSDKPETRGHLLIPRDKLSQFKQHLIPEIQQMSSRNLITLRQKLSSLFKKIDHPIKRHTCSKHWWYTFLDKNSEIKSLWESLPKRINVQNSSEQSESASDSPEEMEEEFETGLPSLEEGEAKEEEDEMREEYLYFSPEETAMEREEVFYEADACITPSEELESFIPGPLDIMVNPQAFQHEMMIEELERWREWTSSLDGELEEEPVLRYLEFEPVQTSYRDQFFPVKNDFVSLLEAALEMEMTQS